MNKYYKNILDSHPELTYEDMDWVETVGYITKIMNKNTGSTTYTTINLNMIDKDTKLEFNDILNYVLKGYKEDE